MAVRSLLKTAQRKEGMRWVDYFMVVLWFRHILSLRLSNLPMREALATVANDTTETMTTETENMARSDAASLMTSNHFS